MAEELDGFDWDGRWANRWSLYDWDKWLDGRIWKLVAGEDFTCKLSSMRNAAGKAAQERGMHIRAATVDDGKAIVLQAIPKEERLR